MPPIPVVSPEVALNQAIDSMVALPAFRNAHWGALIVDAEKGDTLYSHNAGKLFMPASNMKIITGTVALTQLGPDFRFRTTFVATGPVKHGVLQGDLVVSGRGDPSVSDHMRGDATLALRDIADSLRAHGVTRVAGAVVAGEHVFTDASLGFGWSWDDLSDDYSAGVDDLLFNEGFTLVIVRGAYSLGSVPRVELRPHAGDPRVNARVARTATGPTTLRLLADSVPGSAILEGTIGPGVTDTLVWVHHDQRVAYVHALADMLHTDGMMAGYPVAQASRPIPTPRPGGGAQPPPRADTLFTLDSPPLRDILSAMEKPSQNQIAEVLLKTIGLERTGVGTADSGRAVAERQLAAWGAQPDGYVIRDGSGLSRYDYLSPETLVHALVAIRRDTAFAAFYDALPIAGVDGTIAHRFRGTAAAGNARAKTGFIANARSLSGYVTTAGGRPLVFSLLCNNWTVPVSLIEQVQDSVVSRLAALPAH